MRRYALGTLSIAMLCATVPTGASAAQQGFARAAYHNTCVAPTYGYDHANISIKGPIRLGGLVFAQLHTPRFGDARTVGCGPQLQPFTLISNVIDGSGTLRAACGGTIALKKGLGEVTLAHFDCQTTIVQATRTMHIPLSLSVQFYWTPLLDALDAVIEPAPPAYRFFSFTGTWIRD